MGLKDPEVTCRTVSEKKKTGKERRGEEDTELVYDERSGLRGLCMSHVLRYALLNGRPEESINGSFFSSFFLLWRSDMLMCPDKNSNAPLPFFFVGVNMPMRTDVTRSVS